MGLPAVSSESHSHSDVRRNLSSFFERPRSFVKNTMPIANVINRKSVIPTAGVSGLLLLPCSFGNIDSELSDTPRAGAVRCCFTRSGLRTAHVVLLGECICFYPTKHARVFIRFEFSAYDF